MTLSKTYINVKVTNLQNAFSNNNARNTHTSIYTYMKIFQIFGIDSRHSSHKQIKSTFILTAENLMRMTLLLVLYIVASESYIILKYCENPKKFLVMSSLFLVSYLMWNQIIKCEANLTKSIEKIRKLEKLLEISPPEKTVKFCYIFFSAICILTICADAYSFAYLSKIAVRTFSFGMVYNGNIHWAIALFAFIMRQFAMNYGNFLVQYFVIFYIIVCRCMKLILTRHSDKNEFTIKRRFITVEQCKNCFIRYRTILSAFNSVNSILGFPIFLGTSYIACEILLSGLKIWKFGYEILFRDIFLFVRHFSLFTAVTFTASDVSEADNEAKNSHIQIMRTLTSEDRRQIKEDIEGLSQMCYSPPFVLRGWGFFEFTKRFYVTAIGCLTTYTLLIINL